MGSLDRGDESDPCSGRVCLVSCPAEHDRCSYPNGDGSTAYIRTDDRTDGDPTSLGHACAHTDTSRDHTTDRNASTPNSVPCGNTGTYPSAAAIRTV